MGRFDRAALSPLRVTDRPTDLPFSLTWQDLANVLVRMDRDRARERRAFTRYEIQGLRDGDRSVILSLRYPTSDGHEGVDLFVKHTPHEAREAERYAQLAAAGVRVPRLLFAVERSDGSHVLGAEFLDTIGIDFASEAEVAELPALVATLNAVPPEALGNSRVAPGGRPEAEFTASVSSALGTAASMDLLRWSPLTIDGWMRLYREAKGWAHRMPAAVTHGELYFQQVGRSGTGPLVVFDLATLGLRPRFSDLCSLLAGLAARTGLDEAALLQRYLDALRAAGSTAPTLAEAHDELRKLRVLSAFQSLPWLVRSLDHPGLGPSALTDNLETLRSDVTALGILAG